MIANTFREACVIGLELQIGALVEDQLAQIRQAQQMLDQHQLGIVELEMLADEFAQIVGHRFAAFHLDNIAAPAAFEQSLELAC